MSIFVIPAVIAFNAGFAILAAGNGSYAMAALNGGVAIFCFTSSILLRLNR